MLCRWLVGAFDTGTHPQRPCQPHGGGSRLRPVGGWGGQDGGDRKLSLGRAPGQEVSTDGDTPHTLLWLLLNDTTYNNMLMCEAGTDSQSIQVIKM